MFGEDTGELKVSMKGRPVVVWRQVGQQQTQGDTWTQARMVLPNAGSDVAFNIIGVEGSGPWGDIAIDDVKVTRVCSDPSAPSTVAPPGTVTTIVHCDFEGDGRCPLPQLSTGLDGERFFKWLRNKGETNTTFTGPEIDHTISNSSGHYLYTEASKPRENGDRAVLITPFFNIGEHSCDIELTFYYNMYGSGIGDLQVQLISHGNWSILWQKVGQQHSDGKTWSKATIVSDKNLRGVVFQMAIIGKIGTTYFGDIAIDDLNINKICLAQNTYASSKRPSTSSFPTKLPSTVTNQDSKISSLSVITKQTTLKPRVTPKQQTSSTPSLSKLTTTKTSTKPKSISNLSTLKSLNYTTTKSNSKPKQPPTTIPIQKPSKHTTPILSTKSKPPSTTSTPKPQKHTTPKQYTKPKPPPTVSKPKPTKYTTEKPNTKPKTPLAISTQKPPKHTTPKPNTKPKPPSNVSTPIPSKHTTSKPNTKPKPPPTISTPNPPKYTTPEPNTKPKPQPIISTPEPSKNTTPKPNTKPKPLQTISTPNPSKYTTHEPEPKTKPKPPFTIPKLKPSKHTTSKQNAQPQLPLTISTPKSPKQTTPDLNTKPKQPSTVSTPNPKNQTTNLNTKPKPAPTISVPKYLKHTTSTQTPNTKHPGIISTQIPQKHKTNFAYTQSRSQKTISTPKLPTYTTLKSFSPTNITNHSTREKNITLQPRPFYSKKTTVKSTQIDNSKKITTAITTPSTTIQNSSKIRSSSSKLTTPTIKTQTSTYLTHKTQKPTSRPTPGTQKTRLSPLLPEKSTSKLTTTKTQYPQTKIPTTVPTQSTFKATNFSTSYPTTQQSPLIVTDKSIYLKTLNPTSHTRAGSTTLEPRLSPQISIHSTTPRLSYASPPTQGSPAAQSGPPLVPLAAGTGAAVVVLLLLVTGGIVCLRRRPGNSPSRVEVLDDSSPFHNDLYEVSESNRTQRSIQLKFGALEMSLTEQEGGRASYGSGGASKV